MLSSTHKCGTGEKLDKVWRWHRTALSQLERGFPRLQPRAITAFQSDSKGQKGDYTVTHKKL